MNRPWDLFLGRAFHAVGVAAVSSWGSYRLLFAPGSMGALRRQISQARAQAAFWNARDKVPAYARFLRQHDAWNPRTFADIPVMDKDSYIRPSTLEELCVGGRLPERDAVIDESSGSSGTATSWVRGGVERKTTRRLIQHGSRATFGDEPFILINAFALGPWATGMAVSMSLVEKCVLKSVGPDIDKVVSTLKQLGPKYRYLIAGYPPFLKALVDQADLDWSDYQIYAAVGGEGMSEGLRAALNRCFQRTVSSFGASDLEINMAVETEYTMQLRQHLISNAALARDLVGTESVPMIFQYDPLNYWIESDADQNLLFTVNRITNVSPRIRYNLHDRGMVLPMPNVESVLGDHGLTIDVEGPTIPLPLMFHWGRQELAIAYYGCNLTPNDLENAIMATPELAAIVNHYALHPSEDDQANKRLEFWMELKAGCEAPPQIDRLTSDLLARLSEVNQDFRESIKMVPDSIRPTLKFFAAGEGPLATQDVRLKRQYIL